MTCEDDTEGADAFSGPRCDCTRAMVTATLWNGQDAVDQALDALGCIDKDQLADVLAEFCVRCYFSVWTRESCIEKSATCAGGGVLRFIHVVHNDTTMHAVYTCTAASVPQS